MNKNQLFRKIPKMDALLAQDAVQKMINMYGYDSVLNALRKEQEKLRLEIACCTDAEQVEEQIAELAVQVRKELESAYCPQLKKVLNGTGTIPVSYTHLDVYKRQDTYSTAETGDCNSSCIWVDFCVDRIYICIYFSYFG